MGHLSSTVKVGAANLPLFGVSDIVQLDVLESGVCGHSGNFDGFLWTGRTRKNAPNSDGGEPISGFDRTLCVTLYNNTLFNASNLAGIDYFCAVHTGYVLFCWKILFLSRGRTLIWNGMTSNALGRQLWELQSGINGGKSEISCENFYSLNELCCACTARTDAG